MAYKNSIWQICLALAMFIGLSRAFDIHDTDLESEESLRNFYERWSSHYKVSRSFEDRQKRFDVFKDNVRYVHKVNQMDKPYKLKLHKFADMTTEEFRAMRSGSNILHYKKIYDQRTNASTGFMYANVDDVPTAVDWREKGSVTRIKPQGDCWSCWAFAAVAAVESINHIRTGKLVSLSEQELLDCDTTFNDGCTGGLMNWAYEFIEKNGITKERNYPYTAIQRTCKKAKMKIPAVSIDGYENVPGYDESALLKAVAHQPVAVGIDCATQDIGYYGGGIYNGECGVNVDHAMTVVGYGIDHGMKYWILKNSWTPEWGEDGYIRILRDVPAKEGMCGIAMFPSYPTKNSSNNPSFSEKGEL